MSLATPPRKRSRTKGELEKSSHGHFEADAGFPSLAVVSAYYPSHGGGIELVCAEIVAGLSSAGHQVCWLAFDEAPPIGGQRRTIVPLKGTDFVYRKFGVPFPLVSWSGFSILRRGIADAEVCLIADANFMVSVCAFVLCLLAGRPIVLVQHVGQPSVRSRILGLIIGFGGLLLVKPMLRRADHLVFVSQAVLKHFAGLKRKNAPEVIGHGVATDLFMPCGAADKTALRIGFGLQPDRPIACFAGRLTATKGIAVIVELARQRPDWQFAIAGSGPFSPPGANPPNLTWLGHLSQESLADLYRCSNVLLLPSQSESFSLVVREALASGIAVICNEQVCETDPEIARFLETCLVNLDDIQGTMLGFSEALDRIGQQSAEAARDYVCRECSWQNIVARYSQIICRLAGRSGAPWQ